MLIKEQLLQEFSKMNSVKVSLMVASNEDLFDELMECMLGNEQELARRAAWAMSFCVAKNALLIQKYIPALLEIMNNKTCHVAVKRCATQVLQNLAIPEELEGLAYDYGMAIIADPEESIAAKAYSLQILQNIAIKFPELKQELVQIVEDKMAFETPAFKSRGKRLLKLLK